MVYEQEIMQWGNTNTCWGNCHIFDMCGRILDLLINSLGTNSLIFVNCSVFCDVQHVRSLVLGQNVMFGSVRSSVLLLCDQTSLGTYSLMFANCPVFCDVRHV